MNFSKYFNFQAFIFCTFSMIFLDCGNPAYPLALYQSTNTPRIARPRFVAPPTCQERPVCGRLMRDETRHVMPGGDEGARHRPLEGATWNAAVGVRRPAHGGATCLLFEFAQECFVAGRQVRVADDDDVLVFLLLDRFHLLR